MRRTIFEESEEQHRYASHRVRMNLDASMRFWVKGLPDDLVPQKGPTFDDAAACALWNSGDRSWMLYEKDGYLVQQDGDGIAAVTVNPDGTVVPR